MLDRAQTVPKPKSMPWGTLHLLIVEDVIADVEQVVLTLEAAEVSFTYNTADSETSCRRLLQEQTYNAVLSNFYLVGWDGLQAFRLVQESGQDIPFILVTGNLGEEAAVECIKAGMTDHVLKDRLFRLPTVLERSLQEFQLRQQQQVAAAKIQQQARRETMINQIVQAMRGTLVLEEVLQTTVDLLHETLQVSSCLIFQPDAQQQMQVQYASRASPQRQQLIGRPYSLFAAYKASLTQGNQVSLSDLNQISTPDIQSVVSQFGTGAFLVTPLVYQQDFRGGISLQQCDQCRQWTAEEMSLIKAIADQCAIAIHQARLFNQMKKQAQRERLLNQISQVLNSSLDPQYVLQEIAKWTGKCFRVDRVIIFSLSAQQIQVLNEWRVSDQVVSLRQSRAELSDWPELLDPTSKFRSHQTFHAPDYATLASTLTQSAQIRQMQTRSVLCAPILIHVGRACPQNIQLFGGLALHTTTTQRTFAKGEIQLLERIANQAAIALHNAQTYEHLEQVIRERTQALNREKLISEITNRTKSKFLADMSHELRTPLTSILGFSHVLLEQIFGSLNVKQQQYMTNISSCGQHLLELINDLLDLSKVEAGKEDLNLEVLSVEDMCQSCLSLVQERADQQGLQLSLTIAANATSCIADGRRLNQVLCNLLSNAIRFTRSGSVTLDVSKANRIIQFSVIDTGIGISDADLAHIFEPFVQLDNQPVYRHEGTGLGLVLAYHLVQLHGGEMTVVSEPGQGSCFMLRLPEQPLVSKAK